MCVCVWLHVCVAYLVTVAFCALVATRFFKAALTLSMLCTLLLSHSLPSLPLSLTPTSSSPSTYPSLSSCVTLADQKGNNGNANCFYVFVFNFCQATRSWPESFSVCVCVCPLFVCGCVCLCLWYSAGLWKDLCSTAVCRLQFAFLRFHSKAAKERKKVDEAEGKRGGNNSNGHSWSVVVVRPA